MDVAQIVASGDKVVVRVSVKGTPEGESMGVQATGKASGDGRALRSMSVRGRS